MIEIKIQIPEGYDGIDEEKSNLAEGRIVFKKKKVTPWRQSNPQITGFYIDKLSYMMEQKDPVSFDDNNKNIFANKKQAESMLAMAQLSQIIQNDERFGGPITDEEWNDNQIYKYCIVRIENDIQLDLLWTCYHFLAFHTAKQRDLFFEENGDLIRQYLMLD